MKKTLQHRKPSVNDVVSAFSAHHRELLKFFKAEQRDFPWRKKVANPYHVYLSEIMSQQSTMPTVLPYFERFIKVLPDVHSLAHAKENEVMNLWAGLGYYSRARNLQKAAQKIVQEWDGAFPKKVSDLLSLPGVGPYTAAAVAAIAFNEKVLPLDGNVIRVLARFSGVEDPLNDSRQRLSLETLLNSIASTLPKGHHGDTAQALMELGSQICRPAGAARCDSCPLRPSCWAFEYHQVASIPRPKLRPQTEEKNLVALIYRSSSGAPLLRQILPGMRLEGQWEFPLWEMDDEKGIAHLAKHYESWGPVSHSITKYRYRVYALEAGAWKGPLPAGHSFWNSPNGAPGPVTRLSQKILLKRGPLSVQTPSPYGTRM